MESSAVPPALRERLGGDGTAGLLELLETTRRTWSTEVTTTCLERFDRRLVEEIGGLRVEMAEGHAKLRTEMAQAEARLVRELQIGFGTIRQEAANNAGSLRQEAANNIGSLRQEIANNRVEFLRWAFLFWVGQFFAVAGLMGVLMRTALAR